MTITEYDARISPEGRLVIPADVRRVLGLAVGDRVRLVVEDSEVRLVSARSLASAIWANNREGAEAGDSTADVRAFRDGDRELVGRRERSRVERDQDQRSEQEIADDLMSALGL